MSAADSATGRSEWALANLVGAAMEAIGRVRGLGDETAADRLVCEVERALAAMHAALPPAVPKADGGTVAAAWKDTVALEEARYRGVEAAIAWCRRRFPHSAFTTAMRRDLLPPASRALPGRGE